MGGGVGGEKYSMALAILNNLVGNFFADLRVEKEKERADADVVDRLRRKFYACYAQRERLRLADDAELQAIIDELGPQAQAIVPASRRILVRSEVEMGCIRGLSFCCKRFWHLHSYTHDFMEIRH